MSSTEIYGVKKNGDVVFIAETSNSWRGAMRVWTKLSEKYGIKGSLFQGFSGLWETADTGVLTPAENIVLKSTFDYVIVQKGDIPLLLEAYREYDRIYPGSSLKEQADIIETEIIENDDWIGVAWNQTSINASYWSIAYDEEKDEEIPYNLFEGGSHRFINI